MKLRSLTILVILLLSLLPAYYISQYLQRTMRPRESAARLFLYLLTNFVLVLVYTMFIVGLIVKLFPVKS
jgi:hypothetical protein